MEEISSISDLKKLGFTYADKIFGKYYSCPISFTSQFYFCPVPLRMDTYSGCSHGCLYCFANNSDMKFINNEEYMKSDKEHISVKPTKFESIKEYFDICFEGKPNKFSNQEAIAIECIKKKVPIHWGGMSDPFQPLEKHLGLSYRTLELLKKYKYPVVCSTKGKLLLDDRYFNLIVSMKEHFALQISLIHYDENVIKNLEPGAPTAEERLRMMKKYSDAGIWVACRIQPHFTDLLPEEKIIIFLDKLKEAGVKHVMVEGMKYFSGNKSANKRVDDAFKKITGKDYSLYGSYKDIGSKNSGNDLELPTWKKYIYAKVFKREIKKRGMTYGAADNDLRFMGDSPCCCGVEPLPAFGKNLIKHNTGYAVFNAMRENRKDIEYSDIEKEWFPEGDFRLVLSKEKILKRYGKDNKGALAIKDMFMKQWNDNGKNSPCQQCNIKCKGCGNYEIKDEKTLEAELKNKGKQMRLF